jgi:hypothetical protein
MIPHAEIRKKIGRDATHTSLHVAVCVCVLLPFERYEMHACGSLTPHTDIIPLSAEFVSMRASKLDLSCYALTIFFAISYQITLSKLFE